MHVCARLELFLVFASQAEDAARRRLGLGVSHNLRVRAMHGNKALLEVRAGEARAATHTHAKMTP